MFGPSTWKWLPLRCVSLRNVPISPQAAADQRRKPRPGNKLVETPEKMVVFSEKCHHLSATLPAERAFPAAVAELGR
jgi:hypothetical protein